MTRACCVEDVVATVRYDDVVVAVAVDSDEVNVHDDVADAGC